MTCVIGGGPDPDQQRWDLTSSREANLRGRVCPAPCPGWNWRSTHGRQGRAREADAHSRQPQQTRGSVWEERLKRTGRGTELSKQISHQGSVFPNNQGAAVAPIGSRWSTFGEWTPVRLSAGLRSPGCCAASSASSPGHLVKVFALIRVNLHYLSLTVPC